MSDHTYAHRFQTALDVNATPEKLFEAMDEHERLSGHMMQSSAMMAGSQMHIDLDDAGGRAVGSKIRMSGTVMGFELEVEEIVTKRAPPENKVWETVGEPRLLVIGSYRMGFEIKPADGRSRLTMFIEYDDPPQPWTLLGRVLGPVYARWCTTSMADGTAEQFRQGAGSSGSVPRAP